MIEIKEIKPVKSEVKKYVLYPIDVLYKDHPYYVPAMLSDEIALMLPEGNPAFEFCESKYFMAFRDGKPVGRIAGIINHVVNERSGKKECRFGMVDFINDNEVVDALFAAVGKWGKEKGMEHLTGPLGFTDMDKEGMLIEGFDQMPTQSEIYNFDYYPRHMERMGFTPDADWLGMSITVPPAVPEKMARLARLVSDRYKVRSVHFTSRKRLVKTYGDAIFALINEAYDSLFGYSPLSEKQIKHYINVYLPFLPLDHISLVADENDNLIAVGITLPSLSRALIKSRGRMFPTGWFHLLKAIKGNTDVVDLMLIAVKPEYQNRGINSMLFADLIPVYIRNGYRIAESNPELESNDKVQAQWQYFEVNTNKRRRAFTKAL